MSKSNYVVTSSGPVVGVTLFGMQLHSVYRGIPYAEDYVGANRFRSAKPITPWQEEFDASRFVKPGIQVPNPAEGFPLDTSMTEYSLALNIWAPFESKPSDKLPVVVWIYGGSFMLGDSSLDQYDGAASSRVGKCVFVSINYRMNALGFLDFRAFDPECEANVGLKDMLLALQWVYDNCRYFGGDPENITLAGHSAGASAVLALLSVPEARACITRAFAMSPCLHAFNTPEQAAGYAREYLDLLGLAPADFQQIYSLPAEQLAAAADQLQRKVSARCRFEFACAPEIDGEFLRQTPLQAAAQLPEDGKRIPLIIGGVSDEGSYFAQERPPQFPCTPDTLDEFFRHYPEFASDEIRDLYERVKPDRKADRLGGDIFFTVPNLLYADAYSTHSPVWTYQFMYFNMTLAHKKLFAMHGVDIPFILRNLRCRSFRPYQRLTFSRRLAKLLETQMSNMLLRFVTDGTPPHTPDYSPQARSCMLTGLSAERPITHPQSELANVMRNTAFFRERFGDLQQLSAQKEIGRESAVTESAATETTPQ